MNNNELNRTYIIKELSKNKTITEHNYHVNLFFIGDVIAEYHKNLAYVNDDFTENLALQDAIEKVLQKYNAQ